MIRRPVRANPPICYICDRKLYAGGWSYELAEEEEGVYRPAHRACALDGIDHGAVRSLR